MSEHAPASKDALRVGLTLRYLTGGIESDHIVRVSDAGIEPDSGMPFLVMDLLQGEELGSLSTRRDPLPPAEVVLYMSQIALALDKTHAAAIVHRDLKPENLFVTARDDGTPCVKILDFGVAKLAVASSLAQRTAVVGTPLYMAPEQIRGDSAVGPRADLYALGHVAYTLLAGKAYWMTEAKVIPSIFALLQRVMAGLPEAATARAAKSGVKLPAALDGWFQQVTAPDPAARPDRATTAVAQLAEVLGIPAVGTTLPALAAAAKPSRPPPSRVRDEERRERQARRERHDRRERPRPPEAPPPSKINAAAATRVLEAGGGREAPKEPPDPRLFVDELTQAYNERYLKIALEQEYAHARKHMVKLSAILFEVADLRGVAKAHGLSMVDMVIKHLAQAVRIYLPPRGILARVGDSIALIVPARGPTGSMALMKVLGQRVRTQLVKMLGPSLARLTLRVGAAHLESSDVSGLEMLERAARGLSDVVVEGG